MNKNQFREQLLNIRNGLKNKAKLSQQINLNVINYVNKHFTNPKIASFVSLENEIDTQIINEHFNEVYLPVVHPVMKHGLWFAKDCKKYYLNKYKIKEPICSAENIIVPWELDIIIVPIVGFNEDKYRMGMGGGFYDYSLSFKKAYKKPLTLGIAFDEQQNNDIIIDKYDIKLDTIITPTRTL